MSILDWFQSAVFGEILDYISTAPTPGLARNDFLLSSKLQIHLMHKIWECGGYKKKYDGTASPHIKIGNSKMLWLMRNLLK